MSRHEHHTPQHAAGSRWQKPSILREFIGDAIGIEPLPGNGYDWRVRATAGLVIIAIFSIGAGLCKGAGAAVNHLNKLNATTESCQQYDENTTVTEVAKDLNISTEAVSDKRSSSPSDFSVGSGGGVEPTTEGSVVVCTTYDGYGHATGATIK